MKTNHSFTTLFPALALALTSVIDSANALSIGDPAPKLEVGEWVQGTPVKEFDSEHVYIVEFWATWCGPCRVSIPHVNALHEKFKDKGLVVIGQDVWETDEEKVAPFVKKMGKDMTYRVVLDDKSKIEKGAMSQNWMAAAERRGIPTAFVVNKQGKIAWIGHPMSLKETILEQILGDNFDIAAFAKEYNKEQQSQKERLAITTKLQKAMKEKDWDTADGAVGELEKNVPESTRYQFGTTRLQILLGRKDYDGASKLAKSLSDAAENNAMFLNNVAWTLATHKELPKQNLLVAESIAERADKAAKGNNATILDTLARVQFLLGKNEQAIATQEKAIKTAPAGREKLLEKTLEAYKAGKLPTAG